MCSSTWNSTGFQGCCFREGSASARPRPVHHRQRADIHQFFYSVLAAGFLAPIVGLTRTADFYGIGVILLAITSLAITLLRGRRAYRHR